MTKFFFWRMVLAFLFKVTSLQANQITFERMGDVSQFISSLSAFSLLGHYSGRQTVLRGAVACQGSLMSMFIIKRTIDRPRPNKKNNVSFPSGHTAMAFCGVMPLVHESNVPTFFKIPVTLLAFSVAASRVESLNHYGTDTMGGIFLTAFWYYIARSFFSEERRWAFFPFFLRKTQGVNFIYNLN
jgi:membrane-associated phospholipid phosphatase